MGCIVSGIVRDVKGIAFVNTPVKFIRVQPLAQDGTQPPPIVEEALSDGTGFIEIELDDGNWTLVAAAADRSFTREIGVPDAVEANIGALIGAPEVYIPAQNLTDAIAAKDAAEAAAAIALAGSPFRVPTFAALSRLTYGTPTGNQIRVAADDIVDVPGVGNYRAAASTATDHHVTTAGGVKLYVLPGEDGALNVLAFGAPGDDATDERSFILAAIDAAESIGGARIVSQPGKVHHYSGRIPIPPGVIIDFGVNSQTSASPSGLVGPQLVATEATGGVDLYAGAGIVATLRTTRTSDFVGPMLDINDSKSTLNYGRNERHAWFDIDIRGNRQPGSMGVRMYSSTSSGVAWVKGKATVGEIDYPFTLETNGANSYVNENWLDLIAYGAVDGLRGIVSGSNAEITANRINITVQTDSLPRAQRALRWDGTENFINLKVWDWSTASVDDTDGGTQVELTASSGGNIIDGFVSRATGSGSFVRNPVVDYGARNTARNIIRVASGRHRGDLSPYSMGPSNLNQRTFCGDQDDSFAFAPTRYTVTASGTTPPDSTSLGRLFDLSGANLSVDPCTDFQVKIDLGTAPGGIIGMGVVLVSGETPDRIRVEFSSDDATYTTALEAGWDNDPVPLHLFRDDGVGNTRYWRLTVENDTPKRCQINRWWAADVGFTRFPGAFATVLDPRLFGVVRINGTQVLRGQRAAVADATGAGDVVAQLNALLARLRDHGIIAT